MRSHSPHTAARSIFERDITQHSLTACNAIAAMNMPTAHKSQLFVHGQLGASLCQCRTTIPTIDKSQLRSMGHEDIGVIWNNVEVLVSFSTMRGPTESRSVNLDCPISHLYFDRFVNQESGIANNILDILTPGRRAIMVAKDANLMLKSC
jgi:hypothetical protein